MMRRSIPARRLASRLQRGFTLLEVMLATLLLAMLLAGTYGAIRTAVKSMHSGEEAIDRTNRLRVAQEFMRRQVSRIMPLAFEHDEHDGTNVVFEGTGKYMRFVAPMPGYLSRGGPYVQTLTFVGSRRGGQQLLFSSTMLNGFDPEEKPEDREPSVLLDDIQDGHFEYRTLDENGEMTDWFEDWEDPSATPLMVRVVTRMGRDSRVSFPEMEIPLLLDVSAGGQRMRAGMGGPMQRAVRPNDMLRNPRAQPQPRPGSRRQ